MMQFIPAFDGFEAKMRASFARQTAMQTLGVTMGRVAPWSGGVGICTPV